ncbi:MAG: P1 family peptidase [Spirochaetales bacterium]|nr:P1 family peptidase [Spirochaetales bacterium]
MNRKGIRELGISIGRYETGPFNALTDVKGIKVGHVTHHYDTILPSTGEQTSIRTGVTAILPATGGVFDKHLVAGGFVLNGIGEMTGLTQVMEWGWLETPILLTNTLSVGTVHSGVVAWMAKRYKLGIETDVIIPVIGETDDSFLNDVRIRAVTPGDVAKAIGAAQAGPVQQGSVGAGTGMTTFDFAGGIGSSSRVLPEDQGGYTLGVLVLSNFGHMHSLTIEGARPGKYLDRMFPKEGRRQYSYGSVIVVVATDAPLLPNQLSRLSKRAALGLGRTGSCAASTSGEIIIAFSTANRLLRKEKAHQKHLVMKYISDAHISPMYEAVIEATEESVVNAIFYSKGINGRNGHNSPPVPAEVVLDILQGKKP